jgi:hypothetical protein
MQRGERMRILTGCVSVALLFAFVVMVFEPWLTRQDAICVAKLLELAEEDLESSEDELPSSESVDMTAGWIGWSFPESWRWFQEWRCDLSVAMARIEEQHPRPPPCLS